VGAPIANWANRLLRHDHEMKLEWWLKDANRCGILAIVNFARTLMAAVR
jgi:hypothetical protein